MSTLAMADSMMSIATTEAGTATLVLPPAAMITFEFKLSTGKATDLETAGKAWQKAADEIEKTCSDLKASVSSVPASAWSSEDRPAYEAKVEEFCSQLAVLQTYCMAVGIALTVLAYALLVYAVFAVAMGTFLAALAVAVIAAAASVVGSPAIAGMQATAATCLTITHVATGILAAAGQLGAVTLAGGALVSAIVEKGRGNDQALNDFMQAQATGSAGALANLGQNAANAGLAWTNRYQDAVPFGGKKGPAGTPLQSIDLDADRNQDKTWNVGGGATVQGAGGGEHEFGAHAKYGDRGWQGVDGEYKYTNALGGSYGGKGGWEEDKDGNNIYSGGVNGGLPGGATGSAEGQYNTGDGSWKGKAEGGYQYEGGNVGGGSVEVEGDGKGNTKWTEETKTMAGDTKNESEIPPWDR